MTRVEEHKDSLEEVTEPFEPYDPDPDTVDFVNTGTYTAPLNEWGVPGHIEITGVYNATKHNQRIVVSMVVDADSHEEVQEMYSDRLDKVAKALDDFVFEHTNDDISPETKFSHEGMTESGPKYKKVYYLYR